jgi:MoaA/NifB/PqqE/SkfB family radical SAM enzyme
MPPYTIIKNPLLEVRAFVNGGRVKAEARGLISGLPVIKSSLEMIDGQLPVKAGDNLCLSTWIPPVPSIAFDRFMKSRMKSLLGIRTPDQVTISITEECPNRCLHCALPDSGKGMRLEPGVVKNIVGQILDMGTTLVIFDGGEPTTYKELPEVVSSVDDRAISTLFTSGAGFTKSLAKELKNAGLYAVNVSLDSPVPEEHDAMRGRQGVFRDAMDAARSALEAGLMVDLYVVIRHDNMRHLQAFHDLARRIGAHELTFFEVVPTGRWTGRPEKILSGEDHAALNSFVSRSESPKIFSVPAALNKFGCFAGRTWTHITPGGDVYPCACLPEQFGNILKEPVAKIWQRMGHQPYQSRKICPMRKG